MMSVRELRDKDAEARATKQKLLQSNRTVIAASSAAVVSVLAGFPFDSIKTRMQTHHYDSIISCVKTTYVEEGTKGFFRGMIPPLITVSIIKSASFSIYEGTKKALVRDGVFKNDTIQSTMALSTVSGSVSGAFIALLSCPLELIKIQRQLELILLKNQIASGQMPIHEVTEASSWKSAKQIVGRKGIFGLWSRVGCHSARDALGTGIYFGSYESAKRLLSKDGSNSGPLVHFMSGGLCGMLSWLFVFPVDAIKTNLQKDIMLEKPKYSNALECASYLCMSKYLESFLL